MVKIGIKSVLIGFILTACINFIYKIDNLDINIAVNIILIALSFGVLVLENKNKTKIDNTEKQKLDTFRNDVLASLNNRQEINNGIKLLSDLVKSNDQLVLNSNELNNNITDSLSNIENKIDTCNKDSINTRIDVINSITTLNNNMENLISNIEKNITSSTVSLYDNVRTVIDNNFNLLDKKFNVLNDILVSIENTSNNIILENNSIMNIGHLITKMNEDINENQYLSNIAKISNRLDRYINDMDDTLKEINSNLDDSMPNIQNLNESLISHKTKNDRNLNDMLDIMDELKNTITILSSTLNNQQSNYKAMNDNVLEKIQSISEVSTRNIKLLKDSYNTLDKIVNNIA